MTKLDPEQIGLLLNDTWRAWRAKLDSRLKPLGLSQGKWRTLVHLSKGGDHFSQTSRAATCKPACACCRAFAVRRKRAMELLEKELPQRAGVSRRTASTKMDIALRKSNRLAAGLDKMKSP